jgi:SAM-dependent methyltransferase
MTDAFDKDYWETHWAEAADREHDRVLLANPYLEREVADLEPGSALDAGCGEGAEAVWLAARGWQVTAADISAAALGQARGRAGRSELVREIEWVEADLSAWEPDRQFDLVMTHYAHPAIGQLAFYERIAKWVAPGGALLIVGHAHHRGGHDHGGHDHDHGGHDHDGHDHGGHDHDGHHHAAADHCESDAEQPPEKVQVSAESITGLLAPGEWTVVTADEVSRTLQGGSDRVVELHDVVVRASRRA